MVDGLCVAPSHADRMRDRHGAAAMHLYILRAAMAFTIMGLEMFRQNL